MPMVKIIKTLKRLDFTCSAFLYSISITYPVIMACPLAPSPLSRRDGRSPSWISGSESWCL